MNLKIGIAIVLLAVAGVVGVSSFKRTMTPYIGFREARTASGLVQVNGKLADKDYVLKPEVAHYCRGLIYPVPDPSFPFLGVHFTRRLDGSVWAGPNAVLALARQGYGRFDVNLRDLLETLSFPGFWKLARRYWRTGLAEMARDYVKALYVETMRDYIPEIRASDVVTGPSGVRAQALTSSGQMVDDFAFHVTERSLHVQNAPSPAATSSLGIARMIVDKAEEAFGLGS